MKSSMWGSVMKGCFERGIFQRAKSRLKGIEDFNIEHWLQDITFWFSHTKHKARTRGYILQFPSPPQSWPCLSSKRGQEVAVTKEGARAWSFWRWCIDRKVGIAGIYSMSGKNRRYVTDEPVEFEK